MFATNHKNLGTKKFDVTPFMYSDGISSDNVCINTNPSGCHFFEYKLLKQPYGIYFDSLYLKYTNGEEFFTNDGRILYLKRGKRFLLNYNITLFEDGLQQKTVVEFFLLYNNYTIRSLGTGIMKPKDIVTISGQNIIEINNDKYVFLLLRVLNTNSDNDKAKIYVYPRGTNLTVTLIEE